MKHSCIVSSGREGKAYSLIELKTGKPCPRHFVQIAAYFWLLLHSAHLFGGGKSPDITLDSNHEYTWKGISVPGVTHIIDSILMKPGSLDFANPERGTLIHNLCLEFDSLEGAEKSKSMSLHHEIKVYHELMAPLGIIEMTPEVMMVGSIDGKSRSGKFFPANVFAGRADRIIQVNGDVPKAHLFYLDYPKESGSFTWMELKEYFEVFKSALVSYNFRERR